MAFYVTFSEFTKSGWAAPRTRKANGNERQAIETGLARGLRDGGLCEWLNSGRGGCLWHSMRSYEAVNWYDYK